MPYQWPTNAIQTMTTIQAKHILAKLGEIGWKSDLFYNRKAQYWECHLWQGYRSVKTAGTTRLSATWAAVLELIRAYA